MKIITPYNRKKTTIEANNSGKETYEIWHRQYNNLTNEWKLTMVETRNRYKEIQESYNELGEEILKEMINPKIEELKATGLELLEQDKERMEKIELIKEKIEEIKKEKYEKYLKYLKKLEEDKKKGDK